MDLRDTILPIMAVHFCARPAPSLAELPGWTRVGVEGPAGVGWAGAERVQVENGQGSAG